MENNALAIIEKEKAAGNLVYVRPEDVQTARMFVPQVTVIPAVREDFHEKPINGRYMPKAHHVDRIGEAAGIEFIAAACGTRKEGDSTYVGWAQGRRRMPDGTYRTSTKQEYEFDVDIRAEEDFLKDSKGNYKTEVAKRKHVIELTKVARQRASTGARLRVIRELVGIPIAFGPEDFKRALVVSRIAVNTDVMLENPETRQAALQIATGASAEIFGPAPKQIEATADEPVETVEAVITDISDATEVDDGFGDEEEPGDGDEVKTLTLELEEWLLDDVVGAGNSRPTKIREAIKSGDPEAMRAMVERCKAYKARQGVAS